MLYGERPRLISTDPLPPLWPLRETPPLGGRYRLEAQIGQSSTCVVLRALDLRTGQPCAVKLLKPASLADAELRQHLQRGAQALGQISHPGVVSVRCFDVDEEGRPYAVMELLVGEDLRCRLRRCYRLPGVEVLAILQSIATTLQGLQALGISDVCLKPSSLFFCAGPDVAQGSATAHIKLLDVGTGFGSTRQGPAHPGTAGQAVRALAALGYELLGGQAVSAAPRDPSAPSAMPAPPLPLRTLRPDLPESVSACFQRILGAKENASLPSCAEFVETLHQALPGPSSTPRAVSNQNQQKPGGDHSAVREPRPVPRVDPDALDRIDRMLGATAQMDASTLESLRLRSERSGRQAQRAQMLPPTVQGGSAVAPWPSLTQAIQVGVPLGLALGALLMYAILRLLPVPVRNQPQPGWRPAVQTVAPIEATPSAEQALALWREVESRASTGRSDEAAKLQLTTSTRRPVNLPLRLADADGSEGARAER